MQHLVWSSKCTQHKQHMKHSKHSSLYTHVTLCCTQSQVIPRNSAVKYSSNLMTADLHACDDTPKILFCQQKRCCNISAHVIQGNTRAYANDSQVLCVHTRAYSVAFSSVLGRTDMNQGQHPLFPGTVQIHHAPGGHGRERKVQVESTLINCFLRILL